MDHKPNVYAYPQGAAPSAPPRGDSPAVVIVDSKYCVPYPVDLNIVRKLMRITSGNFVVTDANGQLLFKAKDPLFHLHDRRMLLDANETPVLNMREKIMSMHHRWEIFSGDSKDPNQLLFTVKRSSMIQLKTKLNVFLAQNKEENKCDFKVKGSWFDGSCVVYVGESDTIVAQMEKKTTALSVLFGKDNFSVTVNPNFDYAFVAALIVILDDINRDKISIGGAISGGSTLLDIVAS